MSSSTSLSPPPPSLPLPAPSLFRDDADAASKNGVDATSLSSPPPSLLHKDGNATLPVPPSLSAPLRTTTPLVRTASTPHRPGPLNVSPSQCPTAPTPTTVPTAPNPTRFPITHHRCPHHAATTTLTTAPNTHNDDYDASANANAHSEEVDSAITSPFR
ncbi:hypothetical protein BDQ17DRAFT_1424871 [Cyathus striatus]|nr:hypothetical protein BDQ17DRAFT_1424871 [Cyathus striatus]